MDCIKILSFIVLLVSVFKVLFDKYYVGIPTNDSNKVNVVIISLGSGDIVNSVTLIKSMVMFTSRVIDIYLFVDDNASAARFNKKFQKWPEHFRSKFNIKYLTAMFPIDNEVYWKMHLIRYHTLKLYLPELLYSLDAVIYLDSDTILFNDIGPLWDKFAEFNATQMIGAGSEYGWGSYGPHVEYPYYGEYGINAGVMLMNLTRLREFELRKQIEPIYANYSQYIRWTDQCIFNIILANKPEAVFQFNCAWNYMIANCLNIKACELENDDGVKLLHGAGKFFESKLPTIFKTIHQAFIKFDLNANRSILDEMQEILGDGTVSDCTVNHKNFLKGLKH